MRELTEAEQAEEVRRIDGPWPMNFVLPMKNLYTTKLGFIFRRHEQTETIVYEGSFMETTWYISLPTQRFDSIAEMVRAGWVGD